MLKKGNKLYFIIALIILVIIGRYTILKDADVPVPVATVVTNDQQIPSIRGSYCWQAKGEGTCVDTAAPHEIVEQKKYTYVVVKPNEKIEFKYDQIPSNISIQQWIADNDYEEIATTARFTAPTEKGKYIISALVRFPNGDLTDTITIEVE